MGQKIHGLNDPNAGKIQKVPETGKAEGEEESLLHPHACNQMLSHACFLYFFYIETLFKKNTSNNNISSKSTLSHRLSLHVLFWLYNYTKVKVM